MFIRKSGDGNYYICRRAPGSSTQRGKREAKEYRNWWLIKAIGGARGGITLGPVYFPNEFIGKKVRFKIDIVDGDINEVKKIIKRISEMKKELNELKEEYANHFK